MSTCPCRCSTIIVEHYDLTSMYCRLNIPYRLFRLLFMDLQMITNKQTHTQQTIERSTHNNIVYKIYLSKTYVKSCCCCCCCDPNLFIFFFFHSLHNDHFKDDLSQLTTTMEHGTKTTLNSLDDDDNISSIKMNNFFCHSVRAPLSVVIIAIINWRTNRNRS